jgi:hypothetical protein
MSHNSTNHDFGFGGLMMDGRRRGERRRKGRRTDYLEKIVPLCSKRTNDEKGLKEEERKKNGRRRRRRNAKPS